MLLCVSLSKASWSNDAVMPWTLALELFPTSPFEILNQKRIMSVHHPPHHGILVKLPPSPHRRCSLYWSLLLLITWWCKWTKLRWRMRIVSPLGKVGVDWEMKEKVNTVNWHTKGMEMGWDHLLVTQDFLCVCVVVPFGNSSSLPQLAFFLFISLKKITKEMRRRKEGGKRKKNEWRNEWMQGQLVL